MLKANNQTYKREHQLIFLWASFFSMYDMKLMKLMDVKINPTTNDKIKFKK